ncbi:MAG: anthranilate phosphoribosyltransferase [Planctomycetes bacterium]|nr:anthranilate phosphoribosyltransferase [Planctomycetota bacterium]
MCKTKPLLRSIEIMKSGQTLSADEIAGAFRVIMSGNATDGLIGAFLGILSMRIPTSAELFGASSVMKESVTKIEFPQPENILDTCGTGGAPKTFNVSTAAGIVAAACGARVAKHGNKSRTGRGSAEVLACLGVNIDATVAQQKRCLEEVGICFCFAPKHHRSVAHVMPVRKELGFPTLFNLLGPLTNPCSAGRQLLGVWDDSYVMPMAESLAASGTTKSAVVHSSDGLDELSVSAPTRIVYVQRGVITEDMLCPTDVGLQEWDRSAVVASDLKEATTFIQTAITPASSGAVRDAIVFSASVSLFLSDVASNVKEGVEIASSAIDTGVVEDTLKRWVEVSHIHTPSTGGK